MQIATAIDVATNCYEFKVAMDKGDVDGAIAAGVAIGMAAVPGQKLIPAPLRKAVHGVVTKSVTKILHSKYGQAAVKAGGELVDAASGKVQSLTQKAANSKAGQFVQKKIGDRAVKQAEQSIEHKVIKETPIVNRGKDGKIKSIDDTQIHHIVPQELKDHTLLKEVGFDFDQRKNLMFLPTKKGSSTLNVQRSIHEGRHMREVKEGILESLDGISMKRTLYGWSNEQTLHAIQKEIITPQRYLLKIGKLPLNKVHQPQAAEEFNRLMMLRQLNKK
ncbi:MAG: AHH domain-containing protein [Alphaproteobacteria bacterium]|nr:AHH domain-containing protein [Alphaproteobacteria bacterium]